MPQLPELLTALTEELVQIRDGRPTGVVFDGTRLARSEDEDFIYLEADLVGDPSTEIDISIHQTRAFIRIERSPAVPYTGDDFETEL